MSVEVLPLSVELFLLFLWCFPDFFLLDFLEVVPVSVEPEVAVPLEVVESVDPLDVLPLWAKADNEKVTAIANANVSSFFIPCLSLKRNISFPRTHGTAFLDRSR